jgi:hypothetical protein
MHAFWKNDWKMIKELIFCMMHDGSVCMMDKL